MDSHELTTRISQKLKAQGIEPDSERIEAKINRLVSEFGVPPAEAERTILQDIFKEHGITVQKPAPASSGTQQIADLSPGEWVTIQGKVVSVVDPPSPAVAQTGVIADPSGAVRFVIFSKSAPALLRPGEWLRIESAVVDEFRGLANLKIHSGTVITPINEDRPLNPVITRIADLAPGIATITAKVIQDWEVRHDRMQQTGLLGDESGTVKFTVWKGGTEEKLRQDQVYTIPYATVEEYQGRLSVTIDPAACIPVDDMEIDASIGAGVHEEPLALIEGKIVAIELPPRTLLPGLELLQPQKVHTRSPSGQMLILCLLNRVDGTQSKAPQWEHSVVLPGYQLARARSSLRSRIALSPRLRQPRLQNSLPGYQRSG